MNTALWISIPLTAIFFFGVWAGIPLWMVLRHPDRGPTQARAVPAYLRKRGTRSGWRLVG
jgi:hypothetical protein